MIKHFLLFAGLLFSMQVIAQTGIGTSTPDPSAKLDVFSTNKGFLPPRVTLTSATDNSTIPSPATGLLVYNVGSVGLQAGYYYWNGVNWATIATASSAGNGVVASDMVKLYSKAYSAATADSTIANATGYKFTVPVSGRYLFDFSSSGYMNQATMSITFKVRQGTTDLGTDVFTNANNNVHVVFTGMVEVNLSSGVTYNVYVSSTGSRDAGDYDRVFYKMVAGNLPVNQHIASTNIQLNDNYLSNDGGNEGIRVDNSGNVEITGKLNVGNPTGNVVTKVSGIVDAGVDVTLGNLKVRMAGSGNRSLQVSTVSGSFSVVGSGTYNAGGTFTGSTINLGNARTINTTLAYLNPNYNFITDGATDTWVIMDISNKIGWRIILIVGSSYFNNFISIERLL